MWAKHYLEGEGGLTLPRGGMWAKHYLEGEGGLNITYLVIYLS